MDFIGILLIVIATTLIGVGVNGLRVYGQARKWVKVSGEIISLAEDCKEVRYSVYWRLKYFFPVAQYVYEFDGKRYQSDRVSFHLQNIWLPEVDQWGNKTREEQKIWYKWRVGSSISVYVDPRRPHHSVLKKEMSRDLRSHYLALITSGFLCLLIFAALKIWWEAYP